MVLSLVPNNRGSQMSDIEDKKAIVRRAVEAYAKAEIACQQIAEAMNELDAIYKDGAKVDMASGGTVVKELALFKTITGAVGSLENKIYAAHKRGTAIAKKCGADVAEELPDGFVTLGGGGR